MLKAIAKTIKEQLASGFAWGITLALGNFFTYLYNLLLAPFTRFNYNGHGKDQHGHPTQFLSRYIRITVSPPVATNNPATCCGVVGFYIFLTQFPELILMLISVTIQKFFTFAHLATKNEPYSMLNTLPGPAPRSATPTICVYPSKNTKTIL